jgi:hypothetical protein
MVELIMKMSVVFFPRLYQQHTNKAIVLVV